MYAKFKSFCMSLDRPLLITSLIHVGVAVFCLVALGFDNRMLLGLPVWIKPFKFAVSISIYTFTLAYLVPFVQHRMTRAIVSYGTVLCMFVEMILIGMQAARGVKSHYNFETVSGSIIFGTMGFFIATATGLLVVLAIYLLRNPVARWTPAFRLAIQLGLWLTVVGCVIGGYSSSGNGHTVGGPDGGPGLPLLNWSTVFGDWRVSHFIGLHALQVFGFVGWLSQSWKRASVFLWILGAMYALVLGYIIWLTIHAQSVFAN